MLTLSDVFSRLSRSAVLPQAFAMRPPEGGALVTVEHYGYQAVQEAPAFVNIGAAFVLWRQAPERRVWRVTPETAAYLRGVGLSFLPELPPKSWSGAAILIESTDQSALFDDVFSVCAYQCADSQGQPRYFIVGLRTPDGTFVSGVRCNLANLNDKMARTGQLLDLDMQDPADPMLSGPPTEEHQRRALHALQFVFALSYYALDPRPDRVTITEAPGLPERDAQGKTRRAGGRPVPLWTYADLAVTPPVPTENATHGALDTARLALEPVVVRPYVRRTEAGKIVVIDAYDAHRWKRPQGLGAKIKI